MQIQLKLLTNAEYFRDIIINGKSLFKRAKGFRTGNIKFLIVNKDGPELIDYLKALPDEESNLLTAAEPLGIKGKLDTIQTGSENKFGLVITNMLVAIGISDPALLDYFIKNGIPYFNTLEDAISQHADLKMPAILPDWFELELINFKCNSLVIEDPFFFSKFREDYIVNRIFRNLPTSEINDLTIIYKSTGIKEKQHNAEKVLTPHDIEQRRISFEKCLNTMKPKCRIHFFTNAGHDRLLFSNSTFFIAGNSFNMSRDPDRGTYIASFSLLKYFQ